MIWIFLFFFREPGRIFFYIVVSGFFFQKKDSQDLWFRIVWDFPKISRSYFPPSPLRRNIMTEFISSDQDRSGSFRIFFFCRTSYLAESSVFGVEGNSVLSGSFRIVQDCQDRFSNFQKKDFLFSWIRSVFCLDSRREFFPMPSGSFRIAQDRSGQWVCCQGGGSRICRQDFSWIPRRCRNRSTSIRIIQDRWGSFRIAQDS